MKIIVCVKQVPASNEIAMDPETNTIIREGVESILNPFDAYAVEEALRIREKHESELISISMGIPSTSEVLKQTIALGMDRTYLLSDKAFAGADTMATAHVLSKGINKIGNFDLIICGKMATDGDTAQVGPMLAEMLNLPHLTDISNIEEVHSDYLICHKLSDDGYMRVKIMLPAVITVVKEINVPRLPSISGMLKGYNWSVPVWGMNDIDVDQDKIGLTGSPTKVVNTFMPDLHRDCQWISGSVRNQAECLLNTMEGKQLVIKRSAD